MAPNLDIVFAKVVVALSIIGVPVGIYQAHRFIGRGIGELFLGAVIGAIIPMILAVFILGIGYGAWWIFE